MHSLGGVRCPFYQLSVYWSAILSWASSRARSRSPPSRQLHPKVCLVGGRHARTLTMSIAKTSNYTLVMEYEYHHHVHEYVRSNEG